MLEWDEVPYAQDTGGKPSRGYPGTNDCVVRSIAIVAAGDYRQIHASFVEAVRVWLHDSESASAQRWRDRGRPAQDINRYGIPAEVSRRWLNERGWRSLTAPSNNGIRELLSSWLALRAERCIVSVSSHMYAMVGGVVHDRRKSIEGGDTIRGRNKVQTLWLPPDDLLDRL